MPNYRTSASAAVMDARMSDVERSTIRDVVMRSGGFCLRGLMSLATVFGRRPADSIGLVAVAVAVGAVVANALFLQVAPHPAPILAIKPRPVATEVTSSLKPAPAVARREDAAAAKADAATATRTRVQIVSDIQRELSRRGFFDEPVDGVYGPKTDAAIRDFEQAAGIKGNSQPDDALLRLIARSTTHAAPTQAPAAIPAPARTATPAPAKPVPTHTRTATAPAPAATPAPTRTAAPTPTPPPVPARVATPAPAPAPVRVATADPDAIPRPPAPIRTGSIPAPSKRIISVQRALADFGYGQVAPTGVMGAETKTAIERFERERKLPVTGQVSDRLVRELAAVTGRPLE